MGSPQRSDWPEDAPLRAGDVIAGKYRVERVIGGGGMGLLLAARHAQLGERVAVKLLSPRIAARPDAAARALREGRVAARLRCEHVARVLDAGTLPGGAPYLVIEHLRGEDLGALLARCGPLPVDVAAGYVVQACAGLAEAHAHGVVHRDLKPANLFLTRRADGAPVVKVIDFGVSKVLAGEPGAGGEPLTASEVALGTPHYMAPEQMRAARDVDGRADIFSLGAVLYRLLTGSAPFPGNSMVAVHERVSAGPPSVRATRPEVPEALDAAVTRCLALDPGDRFADAGALAAALAPFAAPWAAAAAERAASTAAAAARGELWAPASQDTFDEGPTEATGREAPEAPTAPERAPTWLSSASPARDERVSPTAPIPSEPPELPRRPRRRRVMTGLSLALAAVTVAALLGRGASAPPSSASQVSATATPANAGSAPEAPRAPSFAPSPSASAPAPLGSTSARAPAPRPAPSGTSTRRAEPPPRPWTPGPLETPN